jgi:hypothetical protein
MIIISFGWCLRLVFFAIEISWQCLISIAHRPYTCVLQQEISELPWEKHTARIE